jgi:hypothetical protein
MAEEYAFGEPFVDIDEWRDSPRRHRYVHGGFEGTHTRFSFYLPPPELYKGRLFQFLEGGTGGHENTLALAYMGQIFGEGGAWPFDIVFERFGGFLVESNQGHFTNEGNIGTSGDVETFGASAESALYARELARQMYGSAPHHSYVWGASGGGLRTICCLENRPDVWDGGVAWAFGGMSGVSQTMAQAYWWLYCRDRLDEISDATEPGGSGDPFATLDHDQRHALATVYRAGWPRGAENQLWPSGAWMYGWPALKENDPTYIEDFWTQPGYVGHDHPDHLAKVLVDQTAKVTRVHDGDGPINLWRPRDFLGGRSADPAAGADPEHLDRGRRYGIEVDADLGEDPNRMFIVRATMLSGQAKGRQVYVARQGDVLVGERMTVADLFDGVAVGDEVRLDNRELVAFAHRWMYELDLDTWTEEDTATGERTLTAEFAGMGALTMVDGKPIYPQRAAQARPSAQTGRINGKMIHFRGTLDPLGSPSSVAAYGRLVRAHHGDQTDDHYRFWWVENTGHYPPEMLAWLNPEKDPGVWRSRHVTSGGIPDEALIQVVAWVEGGTPPAPNTSYGFTADSGLVLADSAAERGGVQPVVHAAANGGSRTEVRVGEPVVFTGTAEQPPGTGTFVSARWDFHGNGDFAYEHALDGDAETVKVEATHGYDKPGTYFASFRVGARRDGTRGQGQPIENLARVRVVVS